MIGSNGPRMLGITLPYVDSWNTWLCDERSAPQEIAAQRELVDARCHDVGRDPASVGRSCSIAIDPTGKRELLSCLSADAQPLTGSPERVAEAIHAFADEGIDHIQMYMQPSTMQSIEWLAGLVEALER